MHLPRVVRSYIKGMTTKGVADDVDVIQSGPSISLIVY
jgi:hypothetical protein